MSERGRAEHRCDPRGAPRYLCSQPREVCTSRSDWFWRVTHGRFCQREWLADHREPCCSQEGC